MSWQTSHIIKWDEDYQVARLHYAVQKDTIWILHIQYRIIAIDIEKQENIWSYDLGLSCSDPTGLLLDGDLIITTDGESESENLGWVFALNYKTGVLVWKYRVALNVHSDNSHPFCLHEGKLYILSGRKNPDLIILDSQSGALLKKMSNYSEDLYFMYVHEIVDNHLIVHSHMGSGKKLNFDGDRIEVTNLGETNHFARPSVFRQYILLAKWRDPKEKSSLFYVVDITTGEMVYSYSYNEKDYKCYDMILVDEKTAFVKLHHKKRWEDIRLLKIDMEQKKIKWTFETFEKDGTEVQDIYFANNQYLMTHSKEYKSRLALLDTEDGTMTRYENCELDYRSPCVNGHLLHYGGYYEGKYNQYTTQIHQWSEEPIEPVIFDVPCFSATHQNLKDVLTEMDSPEKIALANFKEALVEAQQFGKCAKLFKVMEKSFQRSLHKDVKFYIKKTLTMPHWPGPLNMMGFGEAAKQVGNYVDVLDFGPTDQLCPALLIASETYGHYFYLNLYNGSVFGGHHDSFFSEYAMPLWDSVEADGLDASCFVDNLSDFNFSLCNIRQLMAWQQRYAKLGVEDMSEFYEKVEPTELVRGLSKEMGLQKNEIKQFFCSSFPPKIMFLAGLYEPSEVKKGLRAKIK